MSVHRFECTYVRVSKSCGFKPPILKEILFLRSKGYNNGEIAASAGVSRNTVASYLRRLKETEDDRVAQLLSLVGMLEAGNRKAVLEMIKTFE